MDEADATQSLGDNALVLRHAREEAQRLGHSYVGAEHLLLGLLQSGDAEVMEVLKDAGITPEAVREVLATALPGPERRIGGASERPFTSRAQRILAVVAQRVRSSGRSEVLDRDFLEAILLEGENLAAQVLHRLGGFGPRGRSSLDLLAEQLEQAGIRW